MLCPDDVSLFFVIVFGSLLLACMGSIGGLVQLLCPEKLDLGQLAQTPLASGSSIALDEDLFEWT